MRLRFVFPTGGSGDYVLTQLALANPSPGFRSNAMAPVIADGAALGGRATARRSSIPGR